MSELYIPQDDVCFVCEKRIGDHDQRELWNCLCQSSRTLKSIGKRLDEHLTKKGNRS